MNQAKEELVVMQNKLNGELEVLRRQVDGVSSELVSSKMQYDLLQQKFDEEKKTFFAKQVLIYVAFQLIYSSVNYSKLLKLSEIQP